MAALFTDFSSIEYIHSLRQANFTEEQAETVVKILEKQQQSIQAQAQAVKEQKTEIDAIKTQELVTKKDLEVVKLELQKEIEIVRKDIVSSKNQIILWVTSLLVANGLIQHFFR
jgi:molecular chaperone GrpE (heat shock protein)